MTDHVVAEVDDLPPGERVLVDVRGREIAVFRIDDEYRAYTNWCPHQGGPVGEGRRSGTTASEFDRETLTAETHWEKEGEILVCPWHGWEVDLREGVTCHDETIDIPSHPVRVEGDRIIVEL